MDYDCFSKLATLLNKPCYSRYNYISVSILFNTFMYPVPFRYCYTIKKGVERIVLSHSLALALPLVRIKQ